MKRRHIAVGLWVGFGCLSFCDGSGYASWKLGSYRRLTDSPLSFLFKSVHKAQKRNAPKGLLEALTELFQGRMGNPQSIKIMKLNEPVVQTGVYSFRPQDHTLPISPIPDPKKPAQGILSILLGGPIRIHNETGDYAFGNASGVQVGNRPSSLGEGVYAQALLGPDQGKMKVQWVSLEAALLQNSYLIRRDEQTVFLKGKGEIPVVLEDMVAVDLEADGTPFRIWLGRERNSQDVIVMSAPEIVAVPKQN